MNNTKCPAPPRDVHMPPSAAWHTVLVIEDDEATALMLEKYLGLHGFETTLESDGARGLERAQSENPAAVILDVGLPGMNGLEVCRNLRPDYLGVIMMLTARDAEVDEVVGLELGADHYLPKPVNLRLVEAHLRALLRRNAALDRSDVAHSEIRHGDFRINRATRAVYLGQRAIILSDAEFSLLWLLVENAGSILSRDKILGSLRGTDHAGTGRSIDMCISRLRKRLGDDTAAPRRIKTVRGKGYLFSPADRA